MNINDFKNIQVKYTSVALPPFSINIDLIYEITVENNEMFIVNGNNKIKIDEKILKVYFSPINNNWDKIFQSKNELNNKFKQIKENKQKNIELKKTFDIEED